jgi:hypothetical protein
MRRKAFDQRSSICLLLCLFLSCLAVSFTGAIAAENGEVARELGEIKPKKLTEISGMAASQKNSDILWIHNDGNSRSLFALNTSGKLAALISWQEKIEDFEEVAIGPGPKAGADYLYIGDIGDNNSQRREIHVLRFEEPAMSEARNSQIAIETVEVFRLVYPDRAHNAETLIVDPITGDLFIVTKEAQGARLYTCRASGLKNNAVATLEFVGSLAVNRVSGGTIARDGSRIILRREDWGWLWNRTSGESIAAALRKAPQAIPVRGRRQGANGEAVSLSPKAESYYTVSEGKDQIICEFPLPAAAAPR